MMGSKILIVEDDPNLLNTLKYNLLKEGHNVITAADGADAIEMLEMKNPSWLFLI